MNVRVAWFDFDKEIRYLLYKNIYRYDVSSSDNLTLWGESNVLIHNFAAGEWHHFDIIKEGSISTIYPKLGDNN